MCKAWSLNNRFHGLHEETSRISKGCRQCTVVVGYQEHSCSYSHMRVSVPGIPAAILNAKPVFSINNIAEGIERLSQFLEAGNIALLTGAGVSVDSGIRAYRGKDGRYMNPNFK